MPIFLTCPQGHALKIKDRFAGMSGYCPRCRAPITVPADEADDEQLIDLIPRTTPLESEPVFQQRTVETPTGAADSKDAIEDDEDNRPVGTASSAAGESLLNSGLLKREKICPTCRQFSHVFAAKCTYCGCTYQ